MKKPKYENNKKDIDVCSKCGMLLEEERIGNKELCKQCEIRGKNIKYSKYCDRSPLSRRKEIARAYLREYVKIGKIWRQPCVVCGHYVTEGHHEDYDKPLEVIWLCTEHHREHHKKLKPDPAKNN